MGVRNIQASTGSCFGFPTHAYYICMLSRRTFKEKDEAGYSVQRPRCPRTAMCSVTLTLVIFLTADWCNQNFQNRIWLGEEIETFSIGLSQGACEKRRSNILPWTSRSTTCKCCFGKLSMGVAFPCIQVCKYEYFVPTTCHTVKSPWSWICTSKERLQTAVGLLAWHFFNEDFARCRRYYLANTNFTSVQRWFLGELPFG